MGIAHQMLESGILLVGNAHPAHSLFGKIYKRPTPKLQKKNTASKSSSEGPNAKTAAILGSYAEGSRPIRSEQTFGIGFALVSHR